jgi:GT2 family glycosyltransferase/glycosyltransferase involved in cell wall biosynthesis
MNLTPVSSGHVALGNAAFRNGNYQKSLNHYFLAILQMPEIAPKIGFNIDQLARQRLKQRMSSAEIPLVKAGLPCASLAEAKLLAQTHGIFNFGHGTFETIGFLNTSIPNHYTGSTEIPHKNVEIKNEKLIDQDIFSFVASYPIDVLLITQINTRTLALAWAYRLLWQPEIHILQNPTEEGQAPRLLNFDAYFNEQTPLSALYLLACITDADPRLNAILKSQVSGAQKTSSNHSHWQVVSHRLAFSQSRFQEVNESEYVDLLFEEYLQRKPLSHEKNHYLGLMLKGFGDRVSILRTIALCDEGQACNLTQSKSTARAQTPLAVPDDAPQPTQSLQDFLFSEFGVKKRTHLVNAMRHFRLPMDPTADRSAFADLDTSPLVGVIRALAEATPMSPEPDVSIIIPAYNQLRFTLACIHSILSDQSRYSYEIIVADDCSTDATADVFKSGIQHVLHSRPASNLGFLRNCNHAAKMASGKHIVLLNNDTYVLPGWLNELIEPLERDDNIGLVGSKLVFADGRLQESGGFVFADGSGWNYGRFDDPRDPRYCYLRDSDYVSGAVIAMKMTFWQSLGGFDERYEMAYYEDTDLAFRVREAGQRVVVQPLSQVIHFEGISSGTDITAGVKRYQVVNKETFYERWKPTLASHGVADPHNLPVNRNKQGTILVVDARTPMPDRDSGSMDTYQYLRILKSFGYEVVFVPQNLVQIERYTAMLQTMGVQTLYAQYWMSMQQVFEAWGSRLSHVLLYRAPVANEVYDLARSHAPQAKLIFDTVDLHFLRLEREAELEGSDAKRIAAQNMRTLELDLVQKADATIVLSSFELDLLRKLTPTANLFEIPIVREVPQLSNRSFEQRQDILFVGSFEHPPNIDAVQWFVTEVMPKLQQQGFDGKLIVVGSKMPAHIKALERPGVEMRGFVEDLEALFAEVRLSVAPLRYGAGLKGKVISSLSYGVPVVATPPAVEGGGFVDGLNVSVAETADEMAAAITQIYNKADVWNAQSSAGRNLFLEKFTVNAVSKNLRTLLHNG